MNAMFNTFYQIKSSRNTQVYIVISTKLKSFVALQVKCLLFAFYLGLRVEMYFCEDFSQEKKAAKYLCVNVFLPKKICIFLPLLYFSCL